MVIGKITTDGHSAIAELLVLSGTGLSRLCWYLAITAWLGVCSLADRTAAQSVDRNRRRRGDIATSEERGVRQSRRTVTTCQSTAGQYATGSRL